MKRLLLFLLLPITLFAQEESRILYLIQTGSTASGLNLYERSVEASGKHDHELLQKIGLILLEQGMRSPKPEHQLTALFGAGISMNEKALLILEAGLKNPIPQLQLVALNFLAKNQSNRADRIIRLALKSDFVLIRLEALAYLSKKRVPEAYNQAEALMQKLDPAVWPIFPQLFAMSGNYHSINALKKCMTCPYQDVRIETIQTAAKFQRDDLLPQIRILSTHHNPAEQEACCSALGVLQDHSSIEKIQHLAASRNGAVKLAAIKALYELGDENARHQIAEYAKSGDLFAIAMLGDVEGEEDLLAELLKSKDPSIRINAAVALLNRKDTRSLSILPEILTKDYRDLAFYKIQSKGKGLSALRVIPSSKENLKNSPLLLEFSEQVRNETLLKASDLPEKDFLLLAKKLFENPSHTNIPLLVTLLEKLGSVDAVTLLKEQHQKVGSPLIRNWCNLALFRLKETGPYRKQLLQWVGDKQHLDMLNIDPAVPTDLVGESAAYELTLDEASKLLIESFEALTESQDDDAIEALFQAIKRGNGTNRYALAGLLMRATE